LPPDVPSVAGHLTDPDTDFGAGRRPSRATDLKRKG
jgi:hypothetical protein